MNKKNKKHLNTSKKGAGEKKVFKGHTRIDPFSF